MKNDMVRIILVIVAIVLVINVFGGKKAATSDDGCDNLNELCIEGTCYPEEQAVSMLEQGKQRTFDCDDYDIGDVIVQNGDSSSSLIDMFKKTYYGIPLWGILAGLIGVGILLKKK